jgi:hypothetical protein
LAGRKRSLLPDRVKALSFAADKDLALLLEIQRLRDQSNTLKDFFQRRGGQHQLRCE